MIKKNPGTPKLDINWGPVFFGLCQGYKAELARDQGINPISLRRRTIEFKKVDELKHINFVIKELKKHKETLK